MVKLQLFSDCFVITLGDMYEEEFVKICQCSLKLLPLGELSCCNICLDISQHVFCKVFVLFEEVLIKPLGDLLHCKLVDFSVRVQPLKALVDIREYS